MPTSANVALTLGLSTRPIHLPLIDGAVKPVGIDLTCITEFPEPFTVVRHSRIMKGQLDGGEMSTSSFISSTERDRTLLALPVFPFRSFRHDSIFCHEHAGIRQPSDLKGKRVGVHRYNASTMAWVRGILSDEFGLQPRDIRWYTAGEEVFKVGKPGGVSIEVIPPPEDRDHLIEMAASGQLDAAIEPNDISRPGLARLYPDYIQVQSEYFRRTGIYPIIHTFCLQRRVAEAHPWVAESLLEAYRKAARLVPRYLDAKTRKTYDENKIMLDGGDPYACQLGTVERRTLEAFLNYLVADGALTRKPELESLFAAI
ncbi:MAG: hypothetical protein Q8P24_04100 [Desulfobacterales bacterium]|nr:hypothetical protein [Desulfobacterales bacterium]